MSLTIYPALHWDSLITVEQATEYHEAMGNAAWATVTDEAQLEVALRRGTQFVWARGIAPRFLNPMHPNLVAATAEAALRGLAGPLVSDIAPDARRTVSEKLEGLERKFEYAQPVGAGPSYELIDMLLRPLVLVSTGVSSVPVWR